MLPTTHGWIIAFIWLVLAWVAGGATSVHGQSASAINADALPGWIKTVGARRVPKGQRLFSATSFGAIGDGAQNSTKAIQQAIDACSKTGGGIVTFAPGHYVTGALFLKNNVHLRVGVGVMLIASQEDADYPILPTRVAGIEMKWPAALINVNDQKNVKISGGGVIDGRGEKWWARY